MSLTERLVEELEADPRAGKRMAELLISEPDKRLAMERPDRRGGKLEALIDRLRAIDRGIAGAI